MVLNSLNFCLPGKLLIYPSHLNESLEMNVICWHCYRQISTLSTNVICRFSLVTFNILSLIFFNLNTMSLYVPPQVYPAWDSLCFLDLVDYFLSHVREIFSYYLFQYFLRSFLLLLGEESIPIMWMLVHLMLSQRSLRLSSFFFFLFIFSPIFWSVAVISIILSFRPFIHSSVSVILLLIPSIIHLCLFIL